MQWATWRHTSVTVEANGLIPLEYASHARAAEAQAPVRRDDPRTRARRASLTLVGSTALVTLCVLGHGWPIDGFTWSVLAATPLTACVAGYFKRRILIGVVVIFSVYLAFPDPFLAIPLPERWSLFDDRGGREGTLLSPGLRFGRNGRNTALLESYLGRLEPNWWVQAPRFPGIRDGNERVYSRSMIRSENLPAILAMLPSDTARRQVLACLTDPHNRLRVHQGLLLACLKQFGYPAGYDAERWWAFHEAAFVRERDPARAARVAYGWLEEANRLSSSWSGELGGQLSAASYHVRGDWGRDHHFGVAYRQLQDAPRSERVGLPLVKVVWWPEKQSAAPR